MKLLITGGAGFLGSNLSSRLLDEGHEVVCLDSFTTGSFKNIENLIKHKYFSLMEHDVRTPFDVDCDVVFNLACPASPPRYQLNPVGTMMTNVLGTFNGLELARRKSARFIQASTSEIYGDPIEHPQKETYWGNVNPIGPRSCYDEGKRAAETLCNDFRLSHGVRTTILRIFNTYGPGMARDDGRVVSNMIVQALEGRPLTMYGDGNQTRCFCYVDDLIDAFMRVINHPEDLNGPINLGSDTEVSMLELGEKIQSLIGCSLPFIFKELPGNDPNRRKPNLKKSFDDLHWAPAVNLEEGLARTIKYFQTQ